MSDSFTRGLYEAHHKENRSPGFSILKEERGKIFSHNIGTGKKVLDLGCRDGALTRYFMEKNEITGVDVDSAAIIRASSLGINAIEMDLYGSWEELKGLRFDAVVAGEVLEHLFHPEEIVNKIRQHLVPGGIFIGSVPNAFSLKNRIRLFLGKKKNTPLADPTHINHFSRKEIVSLLSKYFTYVEIMPLGKFAQIDRFWPGMFSFDMVFICCVK